MVRWLFLLFGICATLGANAQDSLGNLIELQRLLKERKARFSQYFEAASKHSGIFGNKTKKDLEKSREILLEIVATDNHILDELNKAIQRRGIAKADYSNDMIRDQQTIDRLRNASDTLNKQLIAIKESNSELQKKIERQWWGEFLLLAVAAFLFWRFLYYRKKYRGIILVSADHNQV